MDNQETVELQYVDEFGNKITEVKEMEDLKEMVLKGDRLRLLRYLDKRIVRLDPSVYNSKK